MIFLTCPQMSKLILYSTDCEYFSLINQKGKKVILLNVDSLSVSFMLIAVFNLWTGINFLPIRLRSNETWLISGFEIRILEFFSTIIFLGRSWLLDDWLKLRDEPWTALKPIGCLPRSGNVNNKMNKKINMKLKNLNALLTLSKLNIIIGKITLGKGNRLRLFHFKRRLFSQDLVDLLSEAVVLGSHRVRVLVPLLDVFVARKIQVLAHHFKTFFGLALLQRMLQLEPLFSTQNSSHLFGKQGTESRGLGIEFSQSDRPVVVLEGICFDGRSRRGFSLAGSSCVVEHVDLLYRCFWGNACRSLRHRRWGWGKSLKNI